MENNQSIQQALKHIRDLLRLDDHLDIIMESHTPTEMVTEDDRSEVWALNNAITETVMSLRIALLKTIKKDLIKTIEKLEDDRELKEESG